jgi:Protein NO VEIN, C-terminal/Type I restriction enzyme R protein N terminus (HSDR_N)
METPKPKVPEQVLSLVERFERNIDTYLGDTYNETLVRVEFINPLFELLGWDVTNKAGYAEAYKDVIHEDALKIGGATKAPDYSFRVGGARKFFLEAKKPSVKIKEESAPAYQLRRYAWSAKLPLSILINFAEFAVYDCRLPPKETDKPSKGRILYLTYEEYADRWEEIASNFSKEAVLQGSFDRFAETGKGKRGTSPVDKEFLAEIETWRDARAKNLALRNPRLSVRDLNFAVQRTIDRIIFLRMCEDRSIESYGQLQALLNGENIYKRLHHLYRLADVVSDGEASGVRDTFSSAPATKGGIDDHLSDFVDAKRLAAEGFRTNPAMRKAAERHAVERARHHCEKRSFHVREHGKPFDLNCQKGRKCLYVEVKGAQSNGGEVILTPNEVDFARKNKMELFVLHSVQVTLRGNRWTCITTGP